MKILEINSVCGIKSTGRIVSDLYDVLTQNGHECKVAYGREKSARVPGKDVYRMGSENDVKFHALMSRITDKTGFYSKSATIRFIEWMQDYNPDIVHLHNIHGYYINIVLLFNYLKSANKKVIWTLHDCWAFTGHCAYFDFVACEKWRSECHDCEQKGTYPTSMIADNSRRNFKRKKELFTGLDMTIVTPSDWLRDITKQSFLSEYEITTVNNGIDLTQFSPVKSNFRKKYKLEDKTIILGVASIWDRRKGLSDFVKLSKMLDDKYKIVLVGLTKSQIDALPKNILAIERTDSVHELTEIYSAADVFLNPTYEDNFPTTNIEALACGTPVITYNTGGSPESIDESSGLVVKQGDLSAVMQMLLQISKFTVVNCTKRSELFDKNNNYLQYLDLINKMRG